jgi:predicted Zn-dependent protease
LIENGVLKGYMFDKMNAKLMGVEPTGNGRRESYAHIPMPRMTNTYMLNGEDTLEQMIASVDDGLYAVNFDGIPFSIKVVFCVCVPSSSTVKEPRRLAKVPLSTMVHFSSR